MSFDFPPDDEVTGTPIADGDQAWVRIRTEDDGTIQPRTGTSPKSGKDWASYPFVIDGGEHDGRWVSLMLTMDPSNFYFRKHISAITGVDLSKGARLDQTIVEDALRSHRFLVSFQVSEKGDKTYVNIEEVLDREAVEAPETPRIPVSADGAGDDENIPF